MDKINNLVTSLLDKEGVELIDLFLSKAKGKPCLKFLVTRETGITLDECAQLNHQIGQILDQQDFLQESYILEVSSPGLDRPLVNTRDFQRCLGKVIRAVLHQPIERENVFIGVLDKVDEKKVVINTKDGRGVSISRENIAKARQHMDFC